MPLIRSRPCRSIIPSGRKINKHGCAKTLLTRCQSVANLYPKSRKSPRNQYGAFLCGTVLGTTAGEMFRFHSHPYRMRLKSERTLPRPKNVPPARFFNGLSSPRLVSKNRLPCWAACFWCERGDSNPHGVTTRTSNVLVYHSNTLANLPEYYNLDCGICQ